MLLQFMTWQCDQQYHVQQLLEEDKVGAAPQHMSVDQGPSALLASIGQAQHSIQAPCRLAKTTSRCLAQSNA